MDVFQNIDWVFFTAIYFICWWLAFLIILPFGVVAQNEADISMTPGTIESAPIRPKLIKKAMVASVLALFIATFFYWLPHQDYIAYEDIPFMPKF